MDDELEPARDRLRRAELEMLRAAVVALEGELVELRRDNARLTDALQEERTARAQSDRALLAVERERAILRLRLREHGRIRAAG